MALSPEEMDSFDKQLDFHIASLRSSNAGPASQKKAVQFLSHVAYDFEASDYENWIGEKAHVALRDARKCKNPHVRKMTADALKPNSHSNIAILLSLTHDSDSKVRAAALSKLTQADTALFPNGVLGTVCKRMDADHEASGLVRLHALQLRMKFPDASLEEDLYEAKMDPDIYVRHRAVENIAKLSLWKKMGVYK